MGGLRALSWSPSQNGLFPNSVVNQKYLAKHGVKKMAQFRVSAKAEEKEEDPKKKDKQSLFGMVTEALDFSQVRSDEDAQLLQEARDATKSGGKMNREQVKLSSSKKIK